MEQVEKLVKYDESKQVFKKINDQFKVQYFFFYTVNYIFNFRDKNSQHFALVGVSLISEGKVMSAFLYSTLFTNLNILR